MQDSRLLSLLLIISNKKKITAKDLSNHFEVSIRTIYRDIDKLCEAGVPIASLGGKGGGYYLMENYNIENLFLNKGEAKTFLSVIDSLDFIFGKNNQFNNIVLKMKQTYEKDTTHENKFKINLSHFSMEEELRSNLLFIDQHIETNRLIVFDYINRRLEYESRTAEPIQLLFSSGDWYMTAYCRNRKDYRKFKLTRMRNLQTGDFYTKRELTPHQIDEIFKNNLKQKSMEIVLKFPNKSHYHLMEHFTKDEITKNDAGDYIVKMQFPNDEGLIRYILSFGSSCEVLQPQELRNNFKNYLKKIQEIYND